jgi:hypothetical protein
MEFHDLHKTVVGNFPELTPVEIQEFVSAFEAVAKIHRRQDGKLDTAHDLAFWKQTVNDRRLDGSVEISHLGLIAGLTGWGDVRMHDWRKEAWNQGVRFVCDLDQYSGRLPTDQWRAVLEGKIPTLIDPRPKSSKGQPVPQVSITIGGEQILGKKFQGPQFWGM